ncbi:MAG: hypothetical protein JXA14_25710 [Anaerolineae bacterium]|nr:hypothetical protein [Anaerolineae bacterium]
MKEKRLTLIGIMLTSMAVLSLEIALTRILSVFMWYHFAFLTISLALLGSGAAGVWLYLMNRHFPQDRTNERLTLLAILFSLSTASALLIYLSMPFNTQTFRGGIDWTTAGTLAFMYQVLALPFVFGGATLALALSRFSSQAGQIYFFDLGGASLGCLLSVIALNLLGGANAVLLVALLGALAALLFALRSNTRGWRIASAVVLVLLLAALLSNLSAEWLQVRRQAGYESDHTILYEKWNALSRVTVYEDPGWLQPFGWGLSTTYTKPDPGHLLLLIDAKAGTPIQKWTPFDWATIDFLRYDLTSIAYYLLPDANSLVIGSGGGRDILTGLLFGARQITGVELNPAIVDAARYEFGEYAGHVYDQPSVRVEVEDARTYLARRDEQFDLIQASLIDTWAASSAGAFALSENSLYTRQAFRTYYERLTPRGIVSFSRWYLPEEPAETLRLVALGLDSWQRSGVGDPAAHIVVIANLAKNRSATEGLATVLLKKTPFTQAEVDRLIEISEQLEFTVLYAPGATVAPNPASDLIGTSDLKSAIDAYALNIAPPTDDRPFFFYFLRPGAATATAPRDSPVYRASAQARQVLTTLLVVSAVAVLLLIIGPMIVRRAHRRTVRGEWSTLGYFAALGLAFMLVEIPLIQRLGVYLGSPTYSLAAVLFTLLLSSGVGSLTTHAVSTEKGAKGLQWRFVALIGVLALQLLLLPPLLAWTQQAPFVGRVALCVAAIAPAGFLMGQPFPLGIKWLGGRAPGTIPWLWAVNGAASVAGSTLATVVALRTGFTIVGLMGICCYGLALLLATQIARRTVGS